MVLPPVECTYNNAGPMPTLSIKPQVAENKGKQNTLSNKTPADCG